MKKALLLSIILYILTFSKVVFADAVDGYYSIAHNNDGISVYTEVTNKADQKCEYGLYIACYDDENNFIAVTGDPFSLMPDETKNDMKTIDRSDVSAVRTFLWYEKNIQPLTYVDIDHDRTVWDNVAIGGGGYVTGLITHPKDERVIYARTDVGGMYKYDVESKCWTQLFDFISPQESNLYGIEGVALDPNHSDTLYVAAGKYEYEDEHDIFRSTDGGKSFERTNFPGQFGGNRPNRNAGECIEVDPLNSNIIFVIARNGSMYKSVNKGNSWQLVPGFAFTPSGDPGRIVFFDRSQKGGTYTKTIYAGMYGVGLCKSENGGETWTQVSGSPSDINRMDMAGEKLFMATSSGVYVYANGQITDITPSAARTKNFSGIAVNPYNGWIAAITKKGDSGGTDFRNRVYLSKDNGTTWTDTYPDSTYEYHAQWSTETDRRISASSALKFVGTEEAPNQVMVSDWYGVWSCDDIGKQSVAWYYNLEGIEETVSFTLCSPPVGHPLFAGIADVEGMFWDNVDEYPQRYLSKGEKWQDVTSIDFCEKYPNIMVRAGGNRWEGKGKAAYSVDYGDTWVEMTYPKNSSGVYAESGRLCISADLDEETGLPIIVAVGYGIYPHYSLDLGQTWTKCNGLPNNLVDNIWSYNNAIAGDRFNPNYFYSFSGSNVYVSSDGGKNFQATARLDNAYSARLVRIYASPYTEGEVWISIEGKGLYKSMDYGKTFTKLSAVKDCLFFGFGKNAPGRDNATVYTYALVNNVWGIYRTVDRGATFVRINSDAEMLGDGPNNIIGDRQRFGVVYITSNGRGVLYGEPASRKEERTGAVGDALLRRISTDTDNITIADLETVGIKNAFDMMLGEYVTGIKNMFQSKSAVLTLGEIQSIVDKCNSPSATLSNICVTNSNLYHAAYNLVAETFNPLQPVYHVYLDQYVDNVDITVTAINDQQKITLDGQPIISGSSIHLEDLQHGDNLYYIEVTSADGETTKTYTLTVNRESRNGIIANSSFGYGTENWKLGKTSPADGSISITDNPGWMTVKRTAAGGAIWRLGLKSDTINIPCNTEMTIEFMASTVDGKMGEANRDINVMKKVGNTAEQSAVSGNSSGSVRLVNGNEARYTFLSGGTNPSELTSCYLYLQTGDSGKNESDVKFNYVRLSYLGADGSLESIKANAGGALLELTPAFDPNVYEYTATSTATTIIMNATGLHGGTTVSVNGKTTSMHLVKLEEGLNEVKVKGTSITGGETEYTLWITKK